jgi:hypothetical protein
MHFSFLKVAISNRGYRISISSMLNLSNELKKLYYASSGEQDIFFNEFNEVNNELRRIQ